MAKNEKNFNTKLYAVITFFGIAATLFLITFTTFKSRYTAFRPEAVATAYVDTIVQTGDGYNAYKNTLASKNQKYGDFIRKYYMYPVIYRDTDYTIDADRDEFTGYNDESFMGEKTLSDDGSLQGQLIDAMYPVYVRLMSENSGWDSYDVIYKDYFAALVIAREAIFGDQYMTDEIMFTALEANVRSYGDSLTGTEDEFDENSGVQTSFKSEGEYQKAYGEDYKLKTVFKEAADIDAETMNNSLNAEILVSFGVAADEITEGKKIATEVYEGESLVAECSVTVVKIGASWYVYSPDTDTSGLYTFYINE